MIFFFTIKSLYSSYPCKLWFVCNDFSSVFTAHKQSLSNDIFFVCTLYCVFSVLITFFLVPRFHFGIFINFFFAPHIHHTIKCVWKKMQFFSLVIFFPQWFGFWFKWHSHTQISTWEHYLSSLLDDFFFFF